MEGDRDTVKEISQRGRMTRDKERWSERQTQ